MSNFKIKLSAYNGYVVMQVLEQTNKFFSKSKEDIKEFKASNGVTIVSEGTPDIRIRGSKITVGLLGFQSLETKPVIVTKILRENPYDSQTVVNLISAALKELSETLCVAASPSGTDVKDFNNFTARISKFRNLIVFQLESLGDLCYNIGYRLEEGNVSVNFVTENPGDYLAGTINITASGEPIIINFSNDAERDKVYNLLVENLSSIDAKISKYGMPELRTISELEDILLEL